MTDSLIVKDNILAVVCPKQKLVKIFNKTSKRFKKATLLKTYRFKEDVPKVPKTITVEHYNHNIWCVSDRGWSEEKEILVYDEKIMQSIKERAIEFYKSKIN